MLKHGQVSIDGQTFYDPNCSSMAQTWLASRIYPVLTWF